MKKLYTLITILLIVVANTKAQQYIEFVENKGQWDNEVKYVGNIKQGKFGLIKNGYIVNKWTGGDFHTHGKQTTNVNHKEAEKAHNWHVKFVDANTNVQIVPAKPTEFLSNYYIGNDASKWAEGCKSYTEFTYKNMYDNIDVHYYTSNGTLKYDIIVHPGGDASKIDILYNGVNKLLKNKNGNLVLETTIGNFEEMQPYTYQVSETGKVKVNSSYQLSGNRVSFNLSNYDKTKPLIIDPTIIFSTHSGSTQDNWGMTATYGPDDSFFGGGWVGGNGFNTGPGPVNGSFSNGEDIVIVKLNSSGNSRLYVTYIGGNADEQPASLIANGNGNLFFLGRTNSSNFPASQILGTGGAFDIVVGKLNEGGTLDRILKIGGTNDDGVNISSTTPTNLNSSSLFYNYGDGGRGEINLDQAGNVLISSSTQSDNFYLSNASQSTKGGAQDAAILKFNNALTSTIFSTYYGGSGNDAGYVISENKETGNLFVAGGTASNNLPGDKTNVLFPTFGGGAAGTSAAVDGYITEFAPNGTVIKSTYFGTSSHDQIYGLQFDKNNFPYVMGISLGSMPVANATFSNAGSHQFVAKLKKDLSGYEFATKFGSNGSTTNISPVAFLVDVCENVYVSGWGGPQFGLGNPNTNGLPVTPDAFKSTTDGNDFYYIVIEKDAQSLLFGSYFGGNQANGQFGEHVDGGTSRFDPKGYIYQAACASCGGLSGTAGYPVVNGIGNGSTNCNLGMTKIRFNYTGVVSELSVRDTMGCAPLTTTFEDLYKNAASYEYDFGDGSPIVATTNPLQTHTYTVPGVYTAKLIAINLNSCNLRDTAIQTIRIRHVAAALDFNGVKQPPCLNLTYQFNNLSVAPTTRPFGANVFRWNFGDGSPTVISSGLAPVTHTYAAAGTYQVKLILLDTAYCNYPDSLVKTFILSTTVTADFVPVNGCAPYTTTIQNTSASGSAWDWNFGSAGTSTVQNPTVTFTNPGTYSVRLIAIDPATCNLRDTVIKTITVHPSPTANFSYTPFPSQLNTPTTYNNLSSNATIYKWKFGDGDSSTAINPTHQFVRTGNYTTCLYAENQFTCRDTFCRDVPAIVEALIDIPNALTPNGDGVNDYVIPRGFGIETITFRIFNRWGNLLFETNERNKGWDGKYNGAVQPKEVYSYTLDAVMVDGTKVKKSGNITLLR